MNLYIQMVDNNPVNHPIAENNLIQAFPNIDIENLPANFAKFERVESPEVGVYEVYQGSTYEWADGVVKDVHQVRSMTAGEILDKQNEAKASWQVNGFASWVFNEETCSFDPPIPYPDDDIAYIWNEQSQNWIRAIEE